MVVVAKDEHRGFPALPDSSLTLGMTGCVVIGAGPAGLATSQQLKTRNIEHVVLERGAIGESWSRVYDSLTLHTGKHMS
ncbi:MAG: NAD(P)-binding domain-containing protein, partial [Thermoanaerobaculia bacterium]